MVDSAIERKPHNRSDVACTAKAGVPLPDSDPSLANSATHTFPAELVAVVASKQALATMIEVPSVSVATAPSRVVCIVVRRVCVNGCTKIVFVQCNLYLPQQSKCTVALEHAAMVVLRLAVVPLHGWQPGIMQVSQRTTLN